MRWASLLEEIHFKSLDFPPSVPTVRISASHAAHGAGDRSVSARLTGAPVVRLEFGSGAPQLVLPYVEMQPVPPCEAGGGGERRNQLWHSWAPRPHV